MTQLWTQLELATTILDDNLDEFHRQLDQNSIVLGLRHMATDETRHKALAHRLTVGAAAADVKAPPGVEVVGLEKVTIVLNYHGVSEASPVTRTRTDSAPNARRIEIDARASCFTPYPDFGELLPEEELLLDE